MGSRRLRDELLAGLRRAAASTLSYLANLSGTRRVVLRRFPYSIVFFDWLDEIYIVAIARAKRHPGYWKGRV